MIAVGIGAGIVVTRTMIRGVACEAVWASAYIAGALVIGAMRVIYETMKGMIIWSYDHAWLSENAIEYPCENMSGTRYQREIIGSKSMGSDYHLTEMKMFGNIGANCQMQSNLLEQSLS